jgi:hypothetical protein
MHLGIPAEDYIMKIPRSFPVMVPVITTVLAPLKYAVIDKTVELLNFLGV